MPPTTSTNLIKSDPFVQPTKKRKINDDWKIVLPTDLLLLIFQKNGGLWCCRLEQLNKNWKQISSLANIAAVIEMQKKCLSILRQKTLTYGMVLQDTFINYSLVSNQIGCEKTLALLESKFYKHPNLIEGPTLLQNPFYLSCISFFGGWGEKNYDSLISNLKSIEKNDFKNWMFRRLITHFHEMIKNKNSTTANNSKKDWVFIAKKLVELDLYFPDYFRDAKNDLINVLIDENCFSEAIELALKHPNTFPAELYIKMIAAQLMDDYDGAKKNMHTIAHLLDHPLKFKMELLFMKKVAMKNLDQILSYIECLEKVEDKNLALETMIEEIALVNYLEALKIVHESKNRLELIERILVALTPVDIQKAKEFLVDAKFYFPLSILSDTPAMHLFFKTQAKINFPEAVDFINSYSILLKNRPFHAFDLDLDLPQFQQAIACVSKLENVALKTNLFLDLFLQAVDLSVSGKFQISDVYKCFNELKFLKSITLESMRASVKSIDNKFKGEENLERIEKMLTFFKDLKIDGKPLETALEILIDGNPLMTTLELHRIKSKFDLNNLEFFDQTLECLNLKNEKLKSQIKFDVLTKLVSICKAKSIHFFISQVLTNSHDRYLSYCFFHKILESKNLDFNDIELILSLCESTFSGKNKLGDKSWDEILLKAINVGVENNFKKAFELAKQVSLSDSKRRAYLILASHQGFQNVSEGIAP